jgi:hypothetical protein
MKGITIRATRADAQPAPSGAIGKQSIQSLSNRGMAIACAMDVRAHPLATLTNLQQGQGGYAHWKTNAYPADRTEDVPFASGAGDLRVF